ncbi:hypothetical protein [Massilia sp. Root351]|jgi:hypothetical protein|uniref:hypothetical protein n=1 Tax=Massilia sp. Root351 TaxID=1736522 RepID=UPI000AAEFC3F|nr:hypothetical protein [Massilia sp. Root351]
MNEEAAYYICRFPTATHVFSPIWKIAGNTAIRLGAPNAKSCDSSYCESESEEAIFDSLRRVLEKSKPTGEIEFLRTELKPGFYYPRMARPNDQHLNASSSRNPGEQENQNLIAMALGQLNVLVRQLEGVCQIVHPSNNTFSTYGHAIRNLLILACTEVETHWRGVLVENRIVKERYTTKDYVMLRDPMRLGEYVVVFPNFPWLESLRPFKSWNEGQPTLSLRWYDAYNAVKHNREKEFERASLLHAFEAVAACAIMLVAQFGTSFDGWLSSDSSRFFNFKALPEWEPSQAYIFPYEQFWENGREEIWLREDYPFKQS